MGGRDRDDLVPQVADDHLDIHRDDRFVLDNQDARTGLAVDLFRRFADQLVDLVRVAADDAPCFRFAESIDRGEQQRLPRERGEAAGSSEEPTFELQSLLRITYVVFCINKKTITDV